MSLRLGDGWAITSMQENEGKTNNSMTILPRQYSGAEIWKFKLKIGFVDSAEDELVALKGKLRLHGAGRVNGDA